MKKELAALLQKAHRSLNTAKKIFNDGDFDFSASRSYYAMFYAAEAALLNCGKTFSKHTAIINAFYHEFVATGVLPKNLHSNFNRAFENRNIGDYAFMVPFPENDAKDLLQNAEMFIAAVENIIKAST